MCNGIAKNLFNWQFIEIEGNEIKGSQEFADILKRY